MDDLITWLRAQLDADLARVPKLGEIALELSAKYQDPPSEQPLEHKAYWELSRASWELKSQVESKRRIIGLVTDAGAQFGDGYTEAYRDVLRLLALPYADRPGYREDWRPE